jgi:hypothetical protein
VPPPLLRRGLLWLALVATAAACTADDSAEPSFDTTDPVVSAERLCPVMWDWVEDMGAIFNAASRAMADLEPGEERRSRWFDAIDELEQRNEQLLTDVDGLGDDPILAPLVADIESGMVGSMAELDDIRALFAEDPSIDDDERHQNRTAQLIVRVEKVIDLPKPELADHDVDGALIAAFRSVPSCRQSIKDADDGSTEAND